MRRIRVIQIVAGVAIGDQSGGAEYFGLQLARHLNRKEYEVALFAMWQYGSAAETYWLDRLSEDSIPVGGLIPRQGSLARELPAISRSFRNFVWNFQPQVISSHSQRSDPLNLLAHWLYVRHPKAVRTVHVSWPWLNRFYLGATLDNFLFPLLFDSEIAVSELIRQRLDQRPVARLFRRKSVLCYNAVDMGCPQALPGVQGQDVPASDLITNRPRIGVIGRLTKEKGHADVLRAMGLICVRRPVYLVIIGAGPLEKDLRDQAEQMGISRFVQFLGSRTDVANLLPQLDLVVSPSLSEGFPTVLLEAMVAGVPVIATDVPGSREVVRPGITGTLVRPSQPALLAEAVLSTLAAPEAAHEMASRARDFALQFNIENAAKRYEEVYRRLVRGYRSC